MNKGKMPLALAQDVAKRSTCHVQVGAVLCDKKGRILAWGWNHANKHGGGTHAEMHALSRANRRRLAGGTAYVWGRWTHSGSIVEARPCPHCTQALLAHGVRKFVHSIKEKK